MWSAAPGWGHRPARQPKVPPPKIYIVEISRPIIGDTWRIKTMCGEHDQEVYPDAELFEIMGSRDVVYYRGIYDVQNGWHFTKRCDQYGRLIKPGWER